MEKKYKSYGSYESCSKCIHDDIYLKKFINVEPKSIADENCGITKNDCNQKRVIKMGQGPTKSNLYLNINCEIGPKHDIEFKQAQNNAQTVCNNVYTRECDPRLTDNKTWDKIMLDQPPVTSEIELEKIYGENLRNYGKNYTSYKSINAGQIQYYVPVQDLEANQKPNYILESNNTNVIRQDPMGGLIPEYHREEITNGMKHVVKDQYMRDRLRYAEWMLDSAMYKRNSRDWGKLWSSSYL